MVRDAVKSVASLALFFGGTLGVIWHMASHAPVLPTPAPTVDPYGPIFVREPPPREGMVITCRLTRLHRPGEQVAAPNTPQQTIVRERPEMFEIGLDEPIQSIGL